MTQRTLQFSLRLLLITVVTLGVLAGMTARWHQLAKQEAEASLATAERDAMSAELMALKIKREQLKSQYGAAHPKLQAIEAQLAAVERMRNSLPNDRK